MKVIIGRSHGPTLEETDDLRRLSVSTDVPEPEIQAALDRWDAGTHDGNHCWLTISVLRDCGPVEEGWKRQFDDMISYAEAHGWVAGGRVRAHIEA